MEEQVNRCRKHRRAVGRRDGDGLSRLEKRPKDPVFARKCLRAALELYEMGKRQEGYQQGNSYGAPYRYNENTWADDMEWAAAELFKATGKRSYLADAKRYASMIGPTSWMQHDTTEHYEFYPFANLGHFALHHAGRCEDENPARRLLSRRNRESHCALAAKSISSGRSVSLVLEQSCRCIHYSGFALRKNDRRHELPRRDAGPP